MVEAQVSSALFEGPAIVTTDSIFSSRVLSRVNCDTDMEGLNFIVNKGNHLRDHQLSNYHRV